MTRYRYFTATTLDGFLADENDSLDWLLSQPQDEDGGNSFEEFIQGVGCVVMGATSYVWVRDYLEKTGDPWPYKVPAFVFTHRQLEPIADQIQFVQGPPEQHRNDIEAAADGKDVYMCGGGGLAADFADAGMLQEMILSIAPVTLGAGRPLFPRPYDLRLTGQSRNGAFACASYEVVGPRSPSA